MVGSVSPERRSFAVVSPAPISEQPGQRELRGGEVRVGHEHPFLSYVDMLLGEIEVYADRRGEPPNDRTGRFRRVQVVDAPEPELPPLLSIVVTASIVPSCRILTCACPFDSDAQAGTSSAASAFAC